ncbi:30S ribosomal protein S10 [Histoplasma capsulatum G186AR]|uniref:Small ribosomal subunit protein uS10m n=2 Tax=Ajellomyces capsulatus TaxID=5037 RepID=C0P040_AJECG|nr:30S ribosomal protein S10 [Histoplasma capsulatum G186AR]EEH02979.1 30S ribosomal protein S10 [Histoplasma capsulatum G186AR]KAG5296053.1 30S ribosomal protein S10 [Histoplasma capsulatum]QSS74036.1 30S ribosomal protein S10 [Histoplasma capsulatum G186AR]
MFSASAMRSTWRSTKRLKISNFSLPISTSHPPAQENASRSVEDPNSISAASNEIRTPSTPLDGTPKEWGERLDQIGSKFRLPRSVQAVYLKPLRRKAEFGLPVCDLQLRSYSARHVEFFADFALRAAYYLNLPAFGPTPLPRITERWTVLKSNFAHKKSQENFERVTLRRLIQIKDGHPDVVQTWLAFLRKHAFHGVGMKANVWDHSPIGIGKLMDETAAELDSAIEAKLSYFGSSKKAFGQAESVADLVDRRKFMNNNSR